MFITLLIAIASSHSSLTIFTKQHPAINISTSNSKITVSALNVPLDTFIIASFSDSAYITYLNNTWNHDYTYYSIENYLQSISSLTITLPTNTQSGLSVTLCSFSAPIPESSLIQISYNTQLQCLNQGIIQNDACECLPNYLGSDCSIQASTIFKDMDQEYSVPSFSGQFFVSAEGLGKKFRIEIKTRSENLQVFAYYYYDTYYTLPSFLCTDNYEEFQGYYIEIDENNTHKNFNIVFSVFCISLKPCLFTIIVEKGKDSSKSKMMPIVVSFCVAGPIIIILVVTILIKCFKKNNASVNQSTWFIDLLNKAFPAYALDEELRDTECSICFDSYKEKFFVREIKCGHIFHSACIEAWLNYMPHCPLCRACMRSAFIMI